MKGKNARILVVEDENIVALDIKYTLENLGYSVPGIAATGEDAIRLAEKTEPDLVLMDIMLKGEMDGIQAAEIIRSKHFIPVIYLTAYSDSRTLERAKVTEPFGYILKPFEEKELKTCIEIALYKHKMEKRLKESKNWFSTTLNSIGEAVIATNNEGRITYMNPVAEGLTGWKMDEAFSKFISEVYRVRSESNEKIENTLIRALNEGGIVNNEFDVVLISKDGREVPVNECGAPIVDDTGVKLGAVLVFRDISERKRAEDIIKRRLRFESAVSRISSRFIGVIDIEKAIRSSLRTIKELIGADGACFYLWNEERSKMKPFYTSSESMNLVEISPSSFPWLFERLKNGETVVIERISEIHDKTHEIKLLEEVEISSLIGLPVYCGSEIEGLLCIYNFNGEEGMVEEDLMLLKVISGILGSAIERQKAEEELRRSFEKLQKSMNTTINAMSKIYENITQKPSRFGRAPGI